MEKGYIDSRPLAEQVMELVLPSVTKLLAEVAKRQHLHIVVMDPNKKPWEIEDPLFNLAEGFFLLN